MSALVALSLVERADAHQLDEYLQATLIGVTPAGIEVEIQLTPGVRMLPLLMSVIDQDRDGRISRSEETAYVERVLREVELHVDGITAPLSLIEFNFPTVEAMREGLGTIVIKLRSARSGHELRFENRHLPQISAYLVNCLADLSDGLVVGKQRRDEAQRSIEFEYSFGAGPRAAWIALGPFWPAVIGMPLAFRMAVIICRAIREKRASSLKTETSRR
jgi:hypothetical protein